MYHLSNHPLYTDKKKLPESQVSKLITNGIFYQHNKNFFLNAIINVNNYNLFVGTKTIADESMKIYCSSLEEYFL